MNIAQIMQQLPPALAKKLQTKLEDCAVSTHLTADEAFDIVDGVVHQLRIEAQLSADATDREIDRLLSMVADAVVGAIFA
jgi:hypothetical protein